MMSGGEEAGNGREVVTATTTSATASEANGARQPRPFEDVGGGRATGKKNNKVNSSAEFRLADLRAQVGGHKIMKVYRENYVCKPLDRRESQFYHSVPPAIEPFIPKFGGILSVGSYESQDDYIILENLTTGYIKPCVLDLKMGTRMYGDFASEKKRKSQDYKTKQTTSSKLGVRLCGYQRYIKSSRSFQKVDKYVGRKVDVAKFEELLQSFFTVGGEVQHRVIASLVQQAEQLRLVIEDLENFRFYSSSLLIVFEGDLRGEATNNTACQEEEEEEDEDIDDDDTTDGFTARGCSNISSCSSGGGCAVGTGSSGGGAGSGGTTADAGSSGGGGSGGGSGGGGGGRKGPVLRLIDFANVTYPGFCKEDVFHEGPDQGFLFGLNNLITILGTITNRGF